MNILSFCQHATQTLAFFVQPEKKRKGKENDLEFMRMNARRILRSVTGRHRVIQRDEIRRWPDYAQFVHRYNLLAARKNGKRRRNT